MKKIAILGGSGFIGRHLINELEKDYKIAVVTRSPGKLKNLESKHVDVLETNYDNPKSLAAIFSTADGVVNLVGEGVGSRWTETKKEKIYNSRIHTGKMIAEAFHLATKKPAFLIQGSGMGVYGKRADNTDENITEESPLATEGFLTNVGIDNEKTVSGLKKLIRLIYIRTGIVLDGDEGALPQMTMPYKFFMGGPMGSGRQWSSWIHIRDEARAIKFLIEHEKTEGAYNLTAPNPVRNAEMAKAIGKALNKPSFIYTPVFVLKLMLGEMADELLLNGVKVYPKRLLEAGFRFEFETIDTAFNDIFKNNKP